MLLLSSGLRGALWGSGLREEKGSRGDWITKGRKGWLPQPGRLWLAGS